MRDTIILFTDSFPYGKGESFLETEISFLSKKFRQIVIIPNTCQGEARIVPENCRVVELKVNFKTNEKIRHYFFRNLFAVFKYYFFLLRFSEQHFYYLKNLISALAELSVMLEESKLYYAACKNDLLKTDLLYFYWFRRPLVQFAFLKAEGKIAHKLVSRAHGWDFDPERNPLGFYPYKEIELQQVDTLSVVSAWGAALLKRIYPKYSHKISSAHLGVTDNGYVVPDPGIGHFHLISCSTVWEIKRLDRIVEMLRYINFDLTWTHIGDGPLFDDIQKRAAGLPINIKCEFLGAKSNSFILDYYSKVHCDLFVNVSRKEGLPVSLMESISFGIPVMGIDMTGIPEIVNKETGFLLGKEFDPKAAAELVTEYHLRPTEEKLALRRSARNYFLNHFNAETNYNKFIVDHLLK